MDYLPSPWLTAKWCGSSRLHPTPPPACPPWLACPCHLSTRVPPVTSTRVPMPGQELFFQLHYTCCYGKSVLNSKQDFSSSLFSLAQHIVVLIVIFRYESNTSLLRVTSQCCSVVRCLVMLSFFSTASHTRNKGPVVLTTQANFVLLFLACSLMTAYHHYKPWLTVPDPHVVNSMQ